MNLLRIETENEYLVTAELPGLEREHVEVKLEGNVVIIASRARRRRARFQGTFTRSFLLPEDADLPGVRANREGDVLNVYIPKRQRH